MKSMLPLLLILVIQSVTGKTDLLSNETVLEIQKLNELGYSHRSEVAGNKAVFSFNISNTTYAVDELDIVSYYFSITFIGEEHHEERTPLENLTNNEIRYHGALNMTNLEKEANYLVCVFFINSTAHLIGSSRFCYVVSVSNNCQLEESEGTFDDRQIYVLLPFVIFILIVAFLYSCIRDYVYRPRTIEALLKTLPQHHADNLESLAPVADNRRRRRTQAALSNRLREDSVLTVDYQPNADYDYLNYHGTDNVSLDVVPE